MNKLKKIWANWTKEIVLSLMLGIPIYFCLIFGLGVGIAVLTHLALVVVYFVLFLPFGRDSSIEAWIAVMIVAVLGAILFPVYQQALAHRHDVEMRHLARDKMKHSHMSNSANAKTNS